MRSKMITEKEHQKELSLAFLIGKCVTINLILSYKHKIVDKGFIKYLRDLMEFTRKELEASGDEK